MKALSRDLATANVYTTGQVARLCSVSTRTAAKWFDTGLLKGYRMPSGDRRIPRAKLIEFLKAHGMPTGGLAEIDDPEMPIVVPRFDGDVPRASSLSTDIRKDLEELDGHRDPRPT